MKEKKSTDELTALIMGEVRKHPAWSDVVGVAVIRPSNMNWDVAFTMHGQRIAPEGAYEIARELRKKYDLADSS